MEDPLFFLGFAGGTHRANKRESGDEAPRPIPDKRLSGPLAGQIDTQLPLAVKPTLHRLSGDILFVISCPTNWFSGTLHGTQATSASERCTSIRGAYRRRRRELYRVPEAWRQRFAGPVTLRKSLLNRGGGFTDRDSVLRPKAADGKPVAVDVNGARKRDQALV